MHEKTYFLDLFSGIGGFALGAYWADLRFTEHYFSEIDPYCVELYKKRFPNSIALGDVTKINYNDLPKGVWLITGGFPCQPHSLCGLRGGGNDKRDLWSECERAIREIRPEIALFENVPGLFTTDNGTFFNRVLSDITKNGYDCEWKCLQACEIGAPHKRARIWIIAYSEKVRLYCNALQKEFNKKENKQRPKEWAQLLTVIAGKYTLEHWEGNESILTGNYDGLPEELDALKGAGNAIVPQCAEMIFNLHAFDIWRIGKNNDKRIF